MNIRFIDGNQMVHGLSEDFFFNGLTPCGMHVAWPIEPRLAGALEPRGQRLGARTNDPVDCMTCLVVMAKRL